MSYFIGEEDSSLNDTNPIETMQSLASYYLRTSSQLTEKILRSIANSVPIFRPSQSLAVLSEDALSSPESSDSSIADIDLIISGGGLKFYHVMGSIAVLQKQFQQNKIQIARVAGASAGAWAALFVIVKIPLEVILESYHQCAENPRRYLHDVYAEDMVFRFIIFYLMDIVASGSEAYARKCLRVMLQSTFYFSDSADPFRTTK